MFLRGLSRPTAWSLILSGACAGRSAAAVPGDWPEPRQNPHLTAIQPLPGAMTSPPVELARYDLGRRRPAMHAIEPAAGSAPLGICLVAGKLQCYQSPGRLLWESHPRGLNFTQIVATQDFDGDGRREILLSAGRPGEPYGAAVLVRLDDGAVAWRYDVEPMSYHWILMAGNYIPDTTAQQIVVLMHAYPPDKDNGYIALFACGGPGQRPEQKWRYDFSEYTCFPTVMQTDLDGDNIRELAVETHSRMWFLDALTGKLRHFAKWDVSPGNVRSYGLVRFVDLDGDDREDFVCIATFSQHHEVLLNRGGRMEKAWLYGWDESVVTGKVVTRYPDPPYADVDGDGRLEIIVSMFNSEGEQAWLVRVYDALTGVIKHRLPGAIAIDCVDLKGDHAAELLVNFSNDPTCTITRGAALFRVADGKLAQVWRDDDATAIAGVPGTARVQRGGSLFAITGQADAFELKPWSSPPPPQPPDFAAVPATLGPASPVLLAADLLGDGRHELILYQEPDVDILRLHDGHIERVARHRSSSLPVMADLDGDGRRELVLTTVTPAARPVVEAITPGLENRRFWRTEFPPAGRAGLPYGRAAYMRTVHLTGRKTPDLYLWAGTPLVRSAGIEGRNGAILWEKGETPVVERYWGACVDFASAFDFNADGREDLLFTNPDFYCVADATSGDALFGPISPQEIFKQPCQGLYTCPVVLASRDGPSADVALVAGHYFHAVMSVRGEPRWYSIPAPGASRTGAEGFLQSSDGVWRMGFGRQNGMFACVNTADGKVRWEIPLGASVPDVAACDVDGDSRQEFIVGTSHGSLLAIGEAGDRPRVQWETQLGAGVGTLILADLNADGASEIITCTTDGYVRVLGAASRPDER